MKIGVAKFFEDATHRLSNILPMAFRHTAHDLSRIRQQETFVVDQGFGVGGRGARRCGAPQMASKTSPAAAEASEVSPAAAEASVGL